MNKIINTNNHLAFSPYLEIKNWTGDQWIEYDKFLEIMGLSSREEMGNGFKIVLDRMREKKNGNGNN
jgi:hypothetical protein